MTSTVTHAAEALLGPAGEHLSTRIDAIAIVLLIVLLVEQELIRAYAGPGASRRMRPLAVGTVPLLLAFVLIVIVRSTGLR